MHTIRKLFGKTKVHKLDMSLGIDQNVLRLDISVDDILCVMQEPEYKNHLGSIESRGVFLKFLHPPQVGEDLSSRYKIKLGMSVLLLDRDF